MELGMTTIPTDALKRLLAYIHKQEVTCPLTPDSLACLGFQDRQENLLKYLREQSESATKAILICVIAERLRMDENQS